MKRIFILILSLMLGVSSFANHWNPDPHQFPTNMNVIAVIEINGIEQTTSSLELGAFYGDECRGSQMLNYYESLDRHMLFLTLYGSYGHTFTFKLYDHEIQQELDLDCDQTISFSSDAIIGALRDPYIFSFTGGSSYTITTAASPEVGGTATGGGTFMMGESCTVSATANAGYSFTDWKENGVTVSSESEYSFAVTSSRTLTACFERTTYTIDAVAMPEVAGMVSGMGTYYENDVCTLSAMPNEHYSFVNWTENGAVVSTESDYTFTVNANRFLTANFLINSYEITAESQPTDGGTITGTGQYEYGSMATLSAIPNGTRLFIDWKENGEVVSTEPDYSFQVTGDRHLVASFTDPYYVVEARVDPEEGGYVEGAGNYMEGSTCHLVAIAATGYTFVNWTEDGEEVSTENDYGFTVTSNRSLTANFLINTYEITAESDPIEGGFIMGTGEFHYGETATVRAYPNDTYYFINWTENGNVVSTQSDYSFQVGQKMEWIFPTSPNSALWWTLTDIWWPILRLRITTFDCWLILKKEEKCMVRGVLLTAKWCISRRYPMRTISSSTGPRMDMRSHKAPHTNLKCTATALWWPISTIMMVSPKTKRPGPFIQTQRKEWSGCKACRKVWLRFSMPTANCCSPEPFPRSRALI